MFVKIAALSISMQSNTFFYFKLFLDLSMCYITSSRSYYYYKTDDGAIFIARSL